MAEKKYVFLKQRAKNTNFVDFYDSYAKYCDLLAKIKVYIVV